MVDLIVENGLIITIDKERRIIKDGALAVDNGEIIDVGKTKDLKSKYSGDIVINADGKIVMPGLVDTHVHLAQALIRGCADDCSLITWLKDRVWPLQGVYTHEDGKLSAELCILEMIKSGTTTFLECMIHSRYGFNGIAETVIKSGVRAVLSKIVMDLTGYAKEESIMAKGMIEEREATIKEALEMHEKWDGAGNGRIKVWFGPRSLGAVTPDLYREVRELADKHKMGITLHINEVKQDSEYTLKEFGKLPVEFFKDVGIVGKDVVAAHMVWAKDKEIKILAETGTNISHCPASNMKLASGIAPVEKMLKMGVNVSLGCDGGPSNNTYDMIREMRLASYLQKVHTLDPLSLPAETVLEMATLNGAKALGMENLIGSLEKGKRADFIIINHRKPHLTPMYNPVSNIVYAASGSDVETVVVDGKIIMKDRKVLTLNEEEILEKAAEQGLKIPQRAGIEIKPRWLVL